jgi:GNAT superfamily N-acetyltransferase
MPYDYFDRYVFECWAGYGIPEVLRRFQLKKLDDKGLVRWTAFDEDDHRIYAFEVRDLQFKGRHAWAFVIERDGALEVEEIYVRPEYRRRGHGRWLADRVTQLAREKGMPLRLWVSFADCKSESEANYPALVATARRLGVRFQPSTVLWAAYFGTTEHPGEDFPVEPMFVPRRPRAPRAAVLAAALALAGDVNATNGRHPDPTILGQVAAIVSSEMFPKPGTPEWGQMNQRRAELIRKDISCQLTPAEQVELDRLQRLSLAAVDEVFPYPQHDEDRERELDERLRRQEAAGE